MIRSSRDDASRYRERVHRSTSDSQRKSQGDLCRHITYLSEKDAGENGKDRHSANLPPELPFGPFATCSLYPITLAQAEHSSRGASVTFDHCGKFCSYEYQFSQHPSVARSRPMLHDGIPAVCRRQHLSDLRDKTVGYLGRDLCLAEIFSDRGRKAKPGNQKDENGISLWNFPNTSLKTDLSWD